MKAFRFQNLFPTQIDNHYPCWVILGFGRVTQGPSQYGRQIEIVAAPWMDNPKLSTPAWDPIQPMLQHLVKPTVPVELLGMFEIGSLWDRHNRVGTVAFESVSLRLQYDPSLFDMASAGKTRVVGAETRYLIPHNSFPLGRVLPSSRILTISNNKYAYRYLVPAMTLVQFYYGGSSELLRALFSPGIGQPNNPAFDPGRTRVDEQNVLHLHLRPGIPVSDARIIASWIMSYGARQAAAVYESTVVPREDGRDGYVQVLPPFQGFEDLEVDGVTIDRGGRYERFLILRIRSGSLPVSYSKVIVENLEHAIAIKGPDLDKTGYTSPGGTGLGKPRRTKIIEVHRTASPAGGRQVTLRAACCERFTDTLTIERIEKSVADGGVKPTRQGSTAEQGEPEMILGAAGPATGMGETKTKIVVKTVSKSPQQQVINSLPKLTSVKDSVTFGSFYEHLVALDAKTDIPHEIVLLPDNAAEDGDGCASYFPLKYKGEDVEHAWLYRIRSRRRRRKLLVVKVIYRQCYFALMEIERKGNEEFQLAIIFKQDMTDAVSPDTLAAYAGAAAARRCVWQDNTASGTILKKQRHIWKDAAGFAETLVGTLYRFVKPED